MRYLALLLSLAVLAGCNPREFSKNPDRFSAYRNGQRYEAVKDLVIVEYNYMKIPLIKPGMQLQEKSADDEADIKAINESDSTVKMAITGKVSAGDQFVVCDFAVDGGWFPCKGNFLLPNPVVKIISGKSKGRKVGISSLSVRDESQNVHFVIDDLPWTMIYQRPDDQVFRLIE